MVTHKDHDIFNFSESTLNTNIAMFLEIYNLLVKLKDHDIYNFSEYTLNTKIAMF